MALLDPSGAVVAFATAVTSFRYAGIDHHPAVIFAEFKNTFVLAPSTNSPRLSPVVGL
jgi:hypothetical protein